MQFKEFLLREISVHIVRTEPEQPQHDRSVGRVTLAGKGQGAVQRRTYLSGFRGVETSAVTAGQPVQEIDGRRHRPHRV